MVVARLVHFLLPERKVVLTARWIAKVFVAADILSFGVQAVGGSMLADDEDEERARMGQKIYMGGIGIQLGFVLIFVFVAAKLQRRLWVLMKNGKVQRSEAWIQPVVWTVFAVLFLIVVCFARPSLPNPSNHQISEGNS